MYFVRQLGKAVAQGAQKLSVEGALVQLKQSVLESMNYVTAEAVIDRIGQPDQFTFEGLARVIRATAQRGSEFASASKK
jgi:hypothetical protein